MKRFFVALLLLAPSTYAANPELTALIQCHD